LTPADLAERLALHTEEARAAFGSQVEELERAGRIVRNRAGLLLIAARANLLSGQVQGHRDGFGFLIRDDGAQDLVLSEHEMSKVLHGDRVLARITGTDRRGRPEARSSRSSSVAPNKLVGRLLNERGVTIVVPEDQRIQQEILVPPGAALTAEPGQVVVVEILQQPQRYVQPVGRVVEVLGAIDDPGMEIEIAVRKFAVPHEFPPVALEQADALPDGVLPKDFRGRVDLRDVPLVTIDGEDARDFDDAVYCEPITGRRKGWRLIVAIADVSHYVRPADAIDVEAQSRSTSVYFPRRVIPDAAGETVQRPVFPEPQRRPPRHGVRRRDHGQGRDRRLPVLPGGHALARAPDVHRRVGGAVRARLARRAARRRPDAPPAGPVRAVRGAGAGARGARRDRPGDDRDVHRVRSERTDREDLPRVRNDAHKLIEECMLAANVCTADFLARSKQPSLYRVHEGPTPERLANVRTLLKTLGLHLEGGDEPSRPTTRSC